MKESVLFLLLVCSSAPAMAQSPAQPAATAHKSTSASKNVPHGAVADPGLVSSKELLIEETGRTGFSGRIIVTSSDTDCRNVNFELHTKYSGSEGLPSSNGIFYPGVDFEFVGHSCLPAKGSQFHAQYDESVEPDEGGSMGLSGGAITSSGPTNLSGSVSMTVPQAEPDVEFTSAPDAPLLFQLRSDGYHYISGSGTVKLPSGRVYTFPPTKARPISPTVR